MAPLKAELTLRTFSHTADASLVDPLSGFQLQSSLLCLIEFHRHHTIPRTSATGQTYFISASGLSKLERLCSAAASFPAQFNL